MAANVEQSHEPQGFEELMRAENWLFHDYRRRRGGGIMSQNQVNKAYAKWRSFPYGRPGRPRLREPLEGGRDIWQPIEYLPRGSSRPDIAESIQWHDDDRIRNAKGTFMSVREWFKSQGPFEVVRPLGFGGLGLTTHFKFKGLPHRNLPSRDIVVKIGLRGPEDRTLRQEEKYTRVIRLGSYALPYIL